MPGACRRLSARTIKDADEPQLPPCLPKTKHARKNGGAFLHGYMRVDRSRRWKVLLRRDVCLLCSRAGQDFLVDLDLCQSSHQASCITTGSACHTM